MYMISRRVRILLDCNGKYILKNQASEATCDGAPKQAAMAVLYVMRSGDVACREVPSSKSAKVPDPPPPHPNDRFFLTIAFHNCKALVQHFALSQAPRTALIPWESKEVPNQSLKIHRVTILVCHVYIHIQYIIYYIYP